MEDLRNFLMQKGFSSEINDSVAYAEDAEDLINTLQFSVDELKSAIAAIELFEAS